MARPRRPGEQELAEGMRLLDRYTILDRIGSGGMATIYRATDDRLDRVVCIKLLRTTLVEGSGSNNTGGSARLPGDLLALPPGGARPLEAAASEHAPHLRLRLPRAEHARVVGAGRAVPRLRVPRRRQPRDAPPPARRAPAPTRRSASSRASAARSPRRTSTASSTATSSRRTSSSRACAASSSPKLADFGIAHSDLKKSDRDGARGTAIERGREHRRAVLAALGRARAALRLARRAAHRRLRARSARRLHAHRPRRSSATKTSASTFNDRVRGDTLVNARLAQIGFAGEVAQRPRALDARARRRPHRERARALRAPSRGARRPAADEHRALPGRAVGLAAGSQPARPHAAAAPPPSAPRRRARARGRGVGQPAAPSPRPSTSRSTASGAFGTSRCTRGSTSPSSTWRAFPSACASRSFPEPQGQRRSST